jgi:hypothetical protein
LPFSAEDIVGTFLTNVDRHPQDRTSRNLHCGILESSKT